MLRRKYKYPAVTADNPASVSKAAIQLLRDGKWDAAQAVSLFAIYELLVTQGQ